MSKTIVIKDSGERQEYASGARRDNAGEKGRMDLLPPAAILRLSKWYQAGASKYGDHNWERGMPMSRYWDAGIRHAFKWLAGCNDEDHLAAVVWNFLCIMHHEQYRPETQDVEAWQGRTSNYIYELDMGDDK